MEQTTIPDYERGLTFEKVWASIQRLEEKQEKVFEEMRESSRRLDKQLGELGNRFGEMLEYLASSGLKARFRALGFVFNELSHDKEFSVGERVIAEADVFLENCEQAMVVEVQTGY